MGGFPLRLVRRVAERGYRQVLHPIIRFHLGELGRRATRGLLLGPPLRSRRGNGVQWRRVRLRPFRIPRIQTREYPNKDINGDDVQSGTTKVWNG